MTKCDAVNEESSFLWEYAKLLDFLCLEVSFGRQWGWSLVGACHFSVVLQLLCGRWFLCQAFSPTTMNTGKGDLSNGKVWCGQCELSIQSLPLPSKHCFPVFRDPFGTNLMSRLFPSIATGNCQRKNHIISHVSPHWLRGRKTRLTPNSLKWIIGSQSSLPFGESWAKFDDMQQIVHYFFFWVNIITFTFDKHMGVSENSGTPKSSILIGFSIINHPFWGTLIFGNTHIHVPSKSHMFFLWDYFGQWHRPVAGQSSNSRHWVGRCHRGNISLHGIKVFQAMGGTAGVGMTDPETGNTNKKCDVSFE